MRLFIGIGTPSAGEITLPLGDDWESMTTDEQAMTTTQYFAQCQEHIEDLHAEDLRLLTCTLQEEAFGLAFAGEEGRFLVLAMSYDEMLGLRRTLNDLSRGKGIVIQPLQEGDA